MLGHNMRKLLQRVGIAEKRVSCADALTAGFLYAKCHHMSAGFVLVGDRLDQILKKADAGFDAQRQHESPEAYKKELRATIEQENQDASFFFELGFACYAVTLAYGAYPKVLSTEETRSVLATDTNLRRPSRWFIAGLTDIRFTPDEAEKFWLERIVPWLYEDGLRRWVGDENMAVMSDLQVLAIKADNEAGKDSPSARLKAATRSLVGKLPIVGEPLAILLFGTKE